MLHSALKGGVSTSLKFLKDQVLDQMETLTTSVYIGFNKIIYGTYL
jgi:hypothetical protein